MRTLIVLLISAASLLGQAINGITTSATRTITLAPDEAVFTIVAATTPNITQQQVTQALENALLPGATLVAVATGQGYLATGVIMPSPGPTVTTQIYYQFTLTVAASAIKDGVNRLEALRTAPPDLIKSLQYTATEQASQASVEAARRTTLPLLMSDVRKRADLLASTTGLKVGNVTGANEYGTPVFGGLSVPTFISSGVITSSGPSGGGLQITFGLSVSFAAN